MDPRYYALWKAWQDAQHQADLANAALAAARRDPARPMPYRAENAAVRHWNAMARAARAEVNAYLGLAPVALPVDPIRGKARPAPKAPAPKAPVPPSHRDRTPDKTGTKDAICAALNVSRSTSRKRLEEMRTAEVIDFEVVERGLWNLWIREPSKIKSLAKPR